MPTTQGLLEHYGHLYLQVVDRNDILGLSAPALLNTTNSLSTIINLWWNGYHGMNAWYRAIDVEHYNFYTYSATFGASASFGRNEDPLFVSHMAIFGESTMLSTLLAQGDLAAGRGLGRAGYGMITVDLRSGFETSTRLSSLLAPHGLVAWGSGNDLLLDLGAFGGLINTVGLGYGWGGVLLGSVDRPFEFWIEQMML